MTDRSIHQLLDAWMGQGPEAAPMRVAESVRREVRSTRQTATPTGWPTRRLSTMNTTVRLGLAAAVVGIAAFIGYQTLTPAVGEVPMGSAEAATPRPPGELSPQRLTIKNGPMSTAVTVDLPADVRLEIDPAQEWVFRLSDGLRPGSWGISIADVTGATNHVGRFAREAIPGSDASSFLAGLDATEGYVISGNRTTSIGGRHAQVVSIGLEGERDQHLDVGGEGGLGFGDPNVVYVVDVDGQILMIHVWGRTESDLAMNRLLADSILESIRFSH